MPEQIKRCCRCSLEQLASPPPCQAHPAAAGAGIWWGSLSAARWWKQGRDCVPNIPRLAGDVNWLFLPPVVFAASISSTAPFQPSRHRGGTRFWECQCTTLQTKARELYPTFLPGAGATEADGDALNETITNYLLLYYFFNRFCLLFALSEGALQAHGLSQTWHRPSGVSAPALPPGMSRFGGLAAPTRQGTERMWHPWVALGGGSLWMWFSHPGSGAAPSLPALAWTLCSQTLPGHPWQGSFDQPLPLKALVLNLEMLWDSPPDAPQHPHGQSHPRRQERRWMQRPARPFWL